MTVYSVHVPIDESDPTRIADLVRLIPEKASFSAFLFGPFWLMAHRAWLACLGWLVAMACIVVLKIGAGFPDSSCVALFLLLQLLLGLEGNQLVRRATSRGRFRLADVVSGATPEEAERMFLRRLSSPPATIRPAGPISRSLEQPGIGLFPQVGG